MSNHPVTWLAPRPLWPGLEGPAARRPSILRFTSDDFMEELLGLLADDPSLLAERVATPETWRDGVAAHPETPRPQRLPLPGFMRQARRERALARPRPAPPPKPAPTKLYQPAHGRYYVATASLACAIPGLPERAFSPGGSEVVGFVLRRLLPAGASGSELAEFAFTPGPGGPRWQMVADRGASAGRLSPGEEMLPVFPLPHADTAASPRTLWGGLVPTGRREEYFAAPLDRRQVTLVKGQAAALLTGTDATGEGSGAQGITARLTRFKAEVAEPWKAMIRACYIACAELQASAESTSERQTRARLLNVGWAGQAWLILLDFAKYLDEFLPEVKAALAGGPRPARAAEAALYDELMLVNVPALPTSVLSGKTQLTTLAEALGRIGEDEAGLEAAEGIYSYGHQDEAGLPAWHFPLVAITDSFARAGAATHFTEAAATPAYDAEVEAPPETSASPAHLAASQAAEKLDLLTVLVARALPVRDESAEQPLPFALNMRNALDQTRGDPGRFVLRFIYLCEECGPLHPPVLSDPSDVFTIAHFFDYDAPARPVRITLPLDTSPAALRKYPRNTAFVMSDMLCGQVQRAKGLGLVDLIRHVLPFPLHKSLDTGAGGSCKSGGADIGMICSLSIPIITLCALILLMIIVSLLDFIFRWLPYFVLCFPVRGLKGKLP